MPNSIIQRSCHLSLNTLLLLLFDLQQQRAVDVWQNTSKGDSCADEGIEFFVSANGELKMAGSDTLDFEILGGILYTKMSVCGEPGRMDGL